MGVRLAAVIVFTCLVGATTSAGAQTAAPSLSRQQRELLEAIVATVDTTGTAIDDVTWQTHVLRASDGSHYIAVSVTPPPALLPPGPIALYVRLATAATGTTALAERSLVREWLQGSRVDPRMVPRSGMVIGEMPAMGASAIGARGGAAVGSADLQAMNLQRERARQRQADDEQKRRAALEGTAVAASSVLPFEDFEFLTRLQAADGAESIERAITAGPGHYDLFVAWASATQAAKGARVHVARRTITLGPAISELSLSTVIVADRVGVRTVPYSAAEQRGHPYSIGSTDIVPARDTVFTPDERLAAAFQIVNPSPDATGKPDVIVNLRLVRVDGAREQALASLSPLIYNAGSLPGDFDVRVGHPLIAALAVPLATIPRGTHRLLITVEDRIAKAVVSGRADFSVIGSARSLLGEAPPLGPRFDLTATLDGSIAQALVDRLTPAAPSTTLARALATARSGRFAELLIEDRVEVNEQAVRSVLTGLALLSLGNAGAISHFEGAQGARLDPAVIDYLIGVARGMQVRDAEAITRWTAARSAGLSGTAIDLVIAAAHLRLREFARAAEAVREAHAAGDSAAGKLLAAARIGEGRNAEAVAILDALLGKSPDDVETRWLLVHALYAGALAAPSSPPQRFLAEAQRYIDAKGRHAALAADWMSVMTK